MKTTESSLNRSRRWTNSCSSIRSLTVRGAIGVAPSLLLRRQFLAQPGHRAVEVVQRQAVHAGNAIVGDPLLASTVRAGDHDPVQHGGEHGALDGKFEGTPGEQAFDHRPTAGLFPQPPEQQRRAEALASQPVGVTGLELRQHHSALGVAGDRTGQPLELAGSHDDLLAAEILDDALFGTTLLPNAVDEVEVGVAVDMLFPDEHPRISSFNGRILSSRIGISGDLFSTTFRGYPGVSSSKSMGYAPCAAKIGPSP